MDDTKFTQINIIHKASVNILTISARPKISIRGIFQKQGRNKPFSKKEIDTNLGKRMLGMYFKLLTEQPHSIFKTYNVKDGPKLFFMS